MAWGAGHCTILEGCEETRQDCVRGAWLDAGDRDSEAMAVKQMNSLVGSSCETEIHRDT